MAQPIKKIVKEAHNITETKIYTLLVDGNNLLRLSMKDDKVNTKGEHYGGVFQFLLQLRMMLQKKSFDYVYVFFDGHCSGLKRYKIYNGYKANREDKNYSLIENFENLSDYGKAYEEKLKSMQNYLFGKNKKKEKSDLQKFIDENFSRERDLLLKYFNELYIRWFFDDEESTEGDDYIAYYVKNKKPDEKIVIMSTDHDLTQLISDTVCVYDHMIKKFITKDNIQEIRGIPVENVVIEKIICGDTSDNIKNIEGVSQNRLHELIPEIEKRPVTINEIRQRAKEKINERLAEKKKPLKWHENIVNGVTKGNYNGDFYEINRKIIDLSNPLISDYAKAELESTMYNVQDPEGRSFNNIYQYIVEDDLTELLDENKFSGFFEPFKSLTNKEIARYKKEIKK